MKGFIRDVLTRLVQALVKIDLVDRDRVQLSPKIDSSIQASNQSLPQGDAVDQSPTQAIPQNQGLDPRRIEIPIIDALTQLPNRLFFTEHLRAARRDGVNGVIGYLDVDLLDFNFVNGTQERDAGDEVLVAVARRLRSCLPEAACLARFGRDDFAVFLPEVSVDEAQSLLQRCMETVRAPMRLTGAKVAGIEGCVGISIGLVPFTGQGIGDAMRAMDIALFAAKHRGRGCIVVFHEDSKGKMAARSELASAVVGLQERNQQLRTEARTDALTSLHNRLALDEVLDRTVCGVDLPYDGVAVAFIDVDHFGKFNRCYGDSGGDTVLRRLGEAFRAASRSDDLVFRKGGEEFVVLMTGVDHDAARGAAERIRAYVEALAIPHAGSQTAKVLTVTIGVGSGTTGATVRALMEAAGKQATAGKNRHERNRVHAVIVQ